MVMRVAFMATTRHFYCPIPPYIAELCHYILVAFVILQPDLVAFNAGLFGMCNPNEGSLHTRLYNPHFN